MRNRGRLTVALVILLILLGASIAGAEPNASITWSVLSVGGGPVASPGGNVALDGTLGQTVVGSSSGPGVRLGVGYWPGVELEGEPTAITLVSFTAFAGAEGVTLIWETGTEIDNEGFNLYRAGHADGPYSKINPGLIPARGDPTSGASYSYLDEIEVEDEIYYYQLEDVDLFGVSTFHGPINTGSGLTGGPATSDTYLPLIFK